MGEAERALLEAYRQEVREMRVAILSLIEVWDHSQFFTTPEHVRRMKPRIEILRENWGFDVIREDQDGAPLPDQPTDWLDAEPDDR